MTLTEKLKKGELKEGDYFYVNTKMGNIFTDCIDYDRPHWDGFKNDVEEVLAPVPSYDEYLESEAHCAVYSDRNKWLKEENTKLKELLKECVGELQDFNNSSYPIVENLLNRINAAIGESEE